ncbi:MAG TPA: site-specific integrase [Gaiellaceae bacterium]|nr:site-specific integrase [Gaiellaceae bacterium]
MFNRLPDGRVEKSERVKDRQAAERALRKKQVAIDEERLGVSRPSNRTFSEWADEYLEIIEKHGRKSSTASAYRTTIETYGKPVLGPSPLRRIGNPDLRRVVEKIRDNGGGDATVSKHLRHLGAIFQAAEDDGLIPRDPGNPVPLFKKSLRLRVVGGVEPFTDAELARLWASLEAMKAASVYVTLCKASVVTGARQGELIGANLDDVDLLNGTLRIERHYDRESGQLTLPKDGEARTVYLIPPARALLESWIAARGPAAGSEPLFPAPKGGRVNGQFLTKLVVKAMEKAKPPVPKLGEGGRERKPFHAFRSTFDRLCRERGQNPEFIQTQMGHSDPRLTLVHYGAWSETAKRAEADRVEAAGFPV